LQRIALDDGHHHRSDRFRVGVGAQASGVPDELGAMAGKERDDQLGQGGVPQGLGPELERDPEHAVLAELGVHDPEDTRERLDQ
jgi:hypothetical protein